MGFRAGYPRRTALDGIARAAQAVLAASIFPSFKPQYKCSYTVSPLSPSPDRRRCV